MKHAVYMKRCFDLGKLGAKNTKSNPMVGAVLVYRNRIIGEGYHKKYGSQHAEVNAIKNVKLVDKNLVPLSRLYVSLEPCSHHGKTPPCCNMIVAEGIKEVFISTLDPNPKVSGRGLRYLIANGVKVTKGILEKEGNHLIAKFKANLEGLPYVILKMALSREGFMGLTTKQIWLSNDLSKIASHSWRTEVDGILIGTNTALIDDPSLTTRAVEGPNPIRIIFDRDLKIPLNNKIYDGQSPTIIVTQDTTKGRKTANHLVVVKNQSLISILKSLFKKGIYSLIIEGGANTLDRFVKAGLWHEARIIKTNTSLKNHYKQQIIKAPSINGSLKNKLILRDNTILNLINDTY